MIRTKINMDQERSIITNLITDKEFAQKVLPILQPKYFKTRYAKIVSGWVKEYWDMYEDVPKALIQDIFLQKQSSLTDEEEMESVATFLQSLSDEQEKTNSNYNVDTSIKYLKLRSLELHKEKIEEALAVHDPVKGEQVIANFSRVGLPEGDGADILSDASKIALAFNETNEYVFKFPGALHSIVGDPMRGDMMAFLAPPKGQKSWALWFTAETAMSQGCNVVYFTLEMPFNPGDAEQAEERVFLPGDGKQRITVYYLVGKESPEEKIAEILENKNQIVTKVLDNRKADKLFE